MDDEKSKGILPTAGATIQSVGGTLVEGAKSVGGSVIDASANTYKAAKKRATGRKEKKIRT